MNPTGNLVVPKSIAIVACGPTGWSWHQGQYQYERTIPKVDEVWSLNKALRTTKADLGFVLDDLVGEARKSAEYYEDLKALRLPIITTTIDHDVRELFPQNHLIAYPYQEIVWELALRFAMASGHDHSHIVHSGDAILRVGRSLGSYMHNSVPMILAYALWLGVKKIFLYGVDYTFPGVDIRESGRANAEYWVGFLRGQGVEVQVSPDSTLLESRSGLPLYGYGARPPALSPPTKDDIIRILQKLGGVDAT